MNAGPVPSSTGGDADGHAGGDTVPVATVRTVLQMRARAGCEEAFEREWLKAAAQIRSVRGNLRQDLMRNAKDPREFTVVSEWTDRAALEAFSTSAARDRLTVALRDLREGAERMTYDILHSVEGVEGVDDTGGEAGRQPEPGIRVLVTTLVEPGEEARFEEAFAVVAAQMRGTPGHVREELLHEPGAPTYHLLAEWTSKADFLAWVQAPKHTDKTGPMIPFLTRAFTRKIFTIVARPPESMPGHAVTPSPETTPSPEITASPAVSAPALTAPVSTPSPASTAPASPASVTTTDVLVVGAGPTGLTLALELARRGVGVRLVDQRTTPNLSADKAIGVHCRTMEIWADQGIAMPAIDRGMWLDGQIVVVNGQQTHRVEWNLPDLPYAHLGLPQYETEDLLTTRLADFGGSVELGLQVTGLTQDADGVDVTLARPGGSTEIIRAGYVVGCDGAHSIVRRTLGFEFAPGAGRFPELFMLCDVEVDWDMPPGYLLRFMAEEDGELRGMLVCVPLKNDADGAGGQRYRIATMAPPRVMKTEAGRDVPAGTWQEFEPPTLAELQQALDRLAPPGTTASNLRWSSVFRISHGIVEQYRSGRIMIAGDAAHLHPPAGGQGMNTGIQDAYNLGWKLALTAQGVAAPGLLDSYEAERRPAGSDVVGRAVKVAFTDEMDFEDQRQQFLHEMQMLLTYSGSPLVSEVLDWELDIGPGKGDRAPDVHGLTRAGVGHPLRFFDLTGGTAHSVVIYVDSSTRESEYADLERMASSLSAPLPAGRDRMLRTLVIASPDAKVAAAGSLPVYLDTAGEYRSTYSPSGPSVYVVRPDGHIGFRSAPIFPGALREHLRKIFTAL